MIRLRTFEVCCLSQELQTVRKIMQSSAVSLHAVKKPLLCIKNGMFSYMLGLNDAESVLVGSSNYETVKKLTNVERRLSQQMVMNNSPFVIIFYRLGPLLEVPK